MSLLALGLNHHTAPVDIRERVAIGDEQLPNALLALQNLPAVNEATIVSTCNRTEIYCGMQGNDSTPVLHWLHHYLDLNQPQFNDYLFRHTDRDVVHHLMRVCSGLDSLVVGEPQILGQMKQAYSNASAAGTVGSELTPLFQSAFSAAKLVRTDTEIGSNPVSVAFAAVSLAKQIFTDLAKHGALLIGAGDTMRLAAQHLVAQGVTDTYIANRTVERARVLAEEVGGQSLALSDIGDALAKVDIVITATGSSLPILGKGAIEKALKARRYRPMLIVDIAVPRDVEPEVGDLDSVFLYSVDDLQGVIETNLQSRQAAAEQAEEIIRNEVEHFQRKARARTATDSIRLYRETVSALQADLLAKAQSQLAAGQDPKDVLQHFAHSLTNKMMHEPTAQMRIAAENSDQELLRAAERLLNIRHRSS